MYLLFTTIKKLGQGSYGTVYRAIHKFTNHVRAIKVIEKAKTKHKERLFLEVETMQEMVKFHINVRIILTLCDSTSATKTTILSTWCKSTLFIKYLTTLRLCTGGDVFDKVLEIGNFTEKEAQVLFV
jgi:calcium-dependent protein kinase